MKPYSLLNITALYLFLQGGYIGIEYTHIPDREQCDWIRSRVEIPTKFSYSKEQKWMILDRLLWADSFERFIQSKYPGEKRFGLDGCEVLIPGMKAIVSQVFHTSLSIHTSLARLINLLILGLKILSWECPIEVV